MEKIKEVIERVFGVFNIREHKKQELANQLRAEKLLVEAREIGKKYEEILES